MGVISGGRRREAKMTNDSGVGIVAEDLGAEEECYDDAVEDGEVFIEELQPSVHPGIRRTTADDFVYVDKGLPSSNHNQLWFSATKNQHSKESKESSSLSSSRDRDPSSGSSSSSVGAGSDSYLSNNGTFHVVAAPLPPPASSSSSSSSLAQS